VKRELLGERRGVSPMWLVALLSAFAAYLASGFYVVGSDEKAAVRRFGRFVRPLRTSGLHYDLPWPWCRVDRVNLTAVRTLSLGETAVRGDELLPEESPRAPAYLTGDKNILLVRTSVQYRLQEESIAAFLYDQADAVARLRLIVESALTQATANCGVDYLQTFGLVELNQRLTRGVRAAAAEAELGLEIDQVTLERVAPPARVQADFLDVANARAEAAKAVHDARTYFEQRIAAASSEAEQLRQQATLQQLSQVAKARGSAARFEQLVSQIQFDATQSGRSYADSRTLAMQRLTLDTLQQALGKVARRVVVDAREPVDLNLPGGALP